MNNSACRVRPRVTRHPKPRPTRASSAIPWNWASTKLKDRVKITGLVLYFPCYPSTVLPLVIISGLRELGGGLLPGWGSVTGNAPRPGVTIKSA